jgi:hypothetical protein
MRGLSNAGANAGCGDGRGGELLVAGSAGAIPAQSFNTSAGTVKMAPVYHVSMLIQPDGENIYGAPTKPGAFSGMPKTDLILITNLHGDHTDRATIASLAKSKTPVMAPAALGATVQQASTIASGETKQRGGRTLETVSMYHLVCGPGQLFHEGLRRRSRVDA